MEYARIEAKTWLVAVAPALAHVLEQDAEQSLDVGSDPLAIVRLDGTMAAAAVESATRRRVEL